MNIVGGSTTFGQTTTQFRQRPSTAAAHNPMKDIEVTSPPDDTVSALAFSPAFGQCMYLVSSSWDNNVRCWEIQQNGQTVPKAQQTHAGPVLDVCWSDDGTKIFSGSCDKTAKMWDLNSNQATQVAQHEAAVRSVHWIKSPNYQLLMTGSWDKTMKFWDTRSAQPVLNIELPERCYCADALYPIAVIATANTGLTVYHLDNPTKDFKKIDSPLKYQHRCISIFKDKNQEPTGFALGSVEGRIAIQYFNATNLKDNFTFKCHRSNGTSNSIQDIYAVNDIAFHPTHRTLSTVGSDGTFSFWDKDARIRLKISEQFDQPITACTFCPGGNTFAYATGYDWSKGHEYYSPQKKNYIFLRSVAEELKKPRNKRV